MTILTRSLAKFSPAASTKAPPPLLGGAARPKSATLTVTIIHVHAWSRPVVDVQGHTSALSSPDYRPGCTLLTGGYTIGKRGWGDGRVIRALPYLSLTVFWARICVSMMCFHDGYVFP